jgi:lipopolysaccharide biosynthesis regulator YciM
MSDYIWYGIAAVAALSAIGLILSGLQSNREYRCKKYGHSWQLSHHGWTCTRCRYFFRT